MESVNLNTLIDHAPTDRATYLIFSHSLTTRKNSTFLHINYLRDVFFIFIPTIDSMSCMHILALHYFPRKNKENLKIYSRLHAQHIYHLPYQFSHLPYYPHITEWNSTAETRRSSLPHNHSMKCIQTQKLRRDFISFVHTRIQSINIIDDNYPSNILID